MVSHTLVGMGADNSVPGCSEAVVGRNHLACDVHFLLETDTRTFS